MENCTHQCNVFDPDLDAVFDEMLDRMQKPGQREAMQSAFEATPEELGEAAVKQATQIDSDTRYDDMDMGYRQTHNK
jgi:hypothetical protein